MCATESVGIEWYRQTKAKQRKEVRGRKTDRGLSGARNVLLVVTVSDICAYRSLGKRLFVLKCLHQGKSRRRAWKGIQ